MMFPLIRKLAASFWSYLGYVLQMKCFDGSWSNCICIRFIFANLISESQRCDCNFSCGENGFKQGWLNPTHWPLLSAFLGNNYANPPQKLEFASSDACCVPTNEIKGDVVDFGGQLECGTVIRPERLTVLRDFPYVSPKGCDHRFSLLTPEEYGTDVCWGLGRTERENRCAVKGATFSPIRPSGRSC